MLKQLPAALLPHQALRMVAAALLRLTTVVVLTVYFAGLQTAAAAEYLLGPQDKVRLKIYEWRASRDAIFEWTALNDIFVVGADGLLFLPFVGEIRAEGRAAGDLAISIGDGLKQHMGLGRAPDVAVEVVQFRPFYIVGHIMQPNEYPYRPGLSVLQAVGIAGGLRTREENLARLEREVISGRGDVGLLTLNTISLLARKARLEAELAGSDKIQFPSVLTERNGDGSTKLLMEQERMIFEARRDGLTTQERALKDLRNFLEKELASLQAQLAFHDKQIALIQKELAGVASLVSKGLAVAPREFALERTVAQSQSDRLGAETALLRARQEISKTDIAILELRNRHTNEVAEALRETQLQLNELDRKTETAVMLLHESEISAPRLLALRRQSDRVEPSYTIVRQVDGVTTEIPAKEGTSVEPGDTVKVDIPFQSPLEAGEVSQNGSPVLPSDRIGAVQAKPDDVSGTN
jgi:protein involved in polysaccharide export with SLBB domain